MQFVVSRNAREGMCVAEDIYDPHGRVLITRGQRLGTHHLVRLRKFHIRAIFIDPTQGEAVVKPTRADLREQCLGALAHAFQQLRQGQTGERVRLDTAAIMAAADALIGALKPGGKPLVTLHDAGIGDDRLLQHSVNVAVLGILLAHDMRVPPDTLRDLAVALLFHDVGMIFLRDELLHAAQTPTPAQADLIRQHAHWDTSIWHVPKPSLPISARLILFHHERLDQSGYLYGLRGDALCLPSRILAVVEAYASLTGPRFGIPAVLPDAAISYLIRGSGTQFAPDVVAALCRRIALYPEATAVQLNSGEYGIVAGLHPDQPHRPVVLIHLDNRGKTLKQPLIVDLTADPGRSILRSAATMPLLRQCKLREHAPAAIDPLLANLG